MDIVFKRKKGGLWFGLLWCSRSASGRAFPWSAPTPGFKPCCSATVGRVLRLGVRRVGHEQRPNRAGQPVDRRGPAAVVGITPMLTVSPVLMGLAEILALRLLRRDEPAPALLEPEAVSRECIRSAVRWDASYQMHQGTLNDS